MRLSATQGSGEIYNRECCVYLEKKNRVLFNTGDGQNDESRPGELSFLFCTLGVLRVVSTEKKEELSSFPTPPGPLTQPTQTYPGLGQGRECFWDQGPPP